jgi:hypothetical protein
VRVLDATRVSDQLQVIIKMLVPSDDDREGTEELEILQRLSSAAYQSDPTNHTVPCLDSFPMPGIENGLFCVMPLLTKYDEPPFATLSEIHDFLTQAFEVLSLTAFIRSNSDRHCNRDCSSCIGTTSHTGKLPSKDLLLPFISLDDF